MKEKELRFALVCYGGVSLAIYMHGVIKEIQKLSRASKIYHAVPDVAARTSLSYEELTAGEARERDTEPVYFELLRIIGRHVDLRVIVDVIAGASAGGINGIMLARALAHDLPMDGLREMWLSAPHVTELLAPEAKATARSKWFLKPFIWAFTRRYLAAGAEDREIRQNLSLFFRSRWFKEPFDGPYLTTVLTEALADMGNPESPKSSLLPAGQKLDLFVTVTDFYGYIREVQLHDPPEIREREHRHVLTFSYQRWPSGDCQTDFDTGNVPSLAFAARATASFPGAFPAVQISEIDEIVEERALPWPGRDHFVSHNFEPHARTGVDPENVSFIDGGVLNNKPFAEAIQAVQGRPAYRQVDRRLLYVDPDPEMEDGAVHGQRPGFFRVLRGALSDIPRSEPVGDDLAWIDGFNRRVRRMKSVVAAALPHVSSLVSHITIEGANRSPTIGEIHEWRETANAIAARDAGFAYEGYINLKLLAVLERVSRLIQSICDCEPESPHGHWVEGVMEAWARERKIYPVAPGGGVVSATGGKPLPPWVQFLLSFDIDFRSRRIRFVIRGLNILYEALEPVESSEVTAELLDEVKIKLYHALDRIREYGTPERLSAETAEKVRVLFSRAMITSGVPGRPPRLPLSDELLNGIDSIVGDFRDEMNLIGLNEEVDRIFAELDPIEIGHDARHQLLTDYIGFAFWDVLTFSITHWRDLGEFDEIQVDRISPDDCQTIRPGGARATLKGIDLEHFAAFLSRKHRENDYLWGRLHAVDRLIDIVADSAVASSRRVADDLDKNELKRRAFKAILDAEEEFLTEIPDVFATLRVETARV